MLSLAGGVWGLPTDPRPLLAPLLACLLLSGVLRSEQIPSQLRQLNTAGPFSALVQRSNTLWEAEERLVLHRRSATRQC